MDSNQVEQRIAQLLAEYTQRIIAEVKSELTDRVMRALAGGTVEHRAPTAAKAAPSSGGAKRTRVALSDDVKAEVLFYIRENPDQTIGKLVKGLGDKVPEKLIRKAVVALKASGEIKQEGERRGTTYKVARKA